MNDFAFAPAEDHAIPANQYIQDLNIYPTLQGQIDEARIGIIEQRIGLIGQRIRLSDFQDMNHQMRFNGVESVLSGIQTQLQENSQKLEIESKSCIAKVDSIIEPIFENSANHDERLTDLEEHVNRMEQRLKSIEERVQNHTEVIDILRVVLQDVRNKILPRALQNPLEGENGFATPASTN
ncbi:hypothetical protein TWF788_003252 [Orbilia oligospora]|uniref:Uncharacterized protein n=1 Tax=Orbilia oligospora TaxID=2813651 RepID=A0A7C8PZZ0_ORBOL|nr:hypothetical protein TWF788_003252 [Orbilia oligospora]